MAPMIMNPSRFASGGWDLDEDFTGCGTTQCDGLWASSDTGAISVNTTNNWIHWIVSRGTNDHIAYNLNTLLGENVSDTSWVFRQSSTWNSKADNAGNQCWFGLGDLSQTSSHNTSWDFLGFMINNWAGNESFIDAIANGSALPAGGTFFPYTNNFVKTLGTKYYFEITRLSATSIQLMYDNDSDFSSPIQNSGSETIASTIINTNYISQLNENAGSTNGMTDLDTDTAQFANGVTVAP